MRRIFVDVSRLVASAHRKALADYFDFRTDFADDPLIAMKKHGTKGVEAQLILRYLEQLTRILDKGSYPDNLPSFKNAVEEIKETCQDKIERAEISQVGAGAIYRAIMEAELKATEKVLETMQLVTRYLNEIA